MHYNITRPTGRPKCYSLPQCQISTERSIAGGSTDEKRRRIVRTHACISVLWFEGGHFVLSMCTLWRVGGMAVFAQAKGPKELFAIQSMVQHLRICLSCFVLGASSLSFPTGANGGLYGDVVAGSQYTLNLQPPEENTHDVLSSLDALMKVEDEKRTMSDEEFAAAKQRLINVGKQRIHDIIAEAFESTALSA